MIIWEAFERIKGYCLKQIKCDNCRFYSQDGCILTQLPCNWEMPKKGGAE